MKISLLFIIGLLAPAVVSAQLIKLKNKPNINSQCDSDLIAPDNNGIEIQPRFPGGQGALSTYIRKHLHWPAGIKREGEVIVGFTVERDGKLSGVKVDKSLTPEYDNEAIRIVKIIPSWIPGKRVTDGITKPARFQMTLPIVFGLN